MDGYDSLLQKKLDAIVPWIGLYIAAASAACTLAMAADAFIGLRHKKFWFPCKYFALNALSLTLLAVATKLPVDHNTNLSQNFDAYFPKHSSLIFMSTAMSNFMSSLGSMDEKELLANVVALAVLVITVSANVFIQIIHLGYSINDLLAITPLLLLLPALVASAVSVPAVKRSLESKFQEKHKAALAERQGVDDRKQEMMKYWVMAETSSPQFVLSRSVVCTTSAFAPLLPAVLLLMFLVMVMVGEIKWLIEPTSSVYGGYTQWILVIQTVGVVIGLIAPACRWSVAVGFKCSANINLYGFGNELIKIETYWVQALVDWRDSFSSLEIGRQAKYLHDAKWLVLSFCIGVQVSIVVLSKFTAFLFGLLVVRPAFWCFTRIKILFMMWNVRSGDDNTDMNLSSYVLLLEGEAEMPRWILRNICRRVEKMIQRGKKTQPGCLVNLLRKCVDFKGVAQFDTHRIPSLQSREPPNCWTLPIVTLTGIVIAIPNIANDKRKQLVSSVREGVALAKIVEKITLEPDDEIFSNIRKGADVTWVGVALYMKWLDTDLRKISCECRNAKEAISKLSGKAEKIVRTFKREVNDPLMENPLNWPVKVLAANSMYRISQSILLSLEVESDQQTDDEGFLFERLSVMIADILAACLTNLAHVITTMCHHNAIEKREESVHEAFLLLGKTEQILQFLQQLELPFFDHDKATYLDEWRAFFSEDNDDSTPNSTSISTRVSCEEDIDVVVCDG